MRSLWGKIGGSAPTPLEVDIYPILPTRGTS